MLEARGFSASSFSAITTLMNAVRLPAPAPSRKSRGKDGHAHMLLALWMKPQALRESAEDMFALFLGKGCNQDESQHATPIL